MPLYIFKHMGRLVHDGAAVDRFAGSTTGVHFLLRVEEACIQSLGMRNHFPESCFGLHLLPASEASLTRSSATPTPQPLNQLVTSRMDRIRRQFIYRGPLRYYTRQIDTFLERWESFCPVLVRNELVQDVEQLLQNLQGSDSPTDMDILPTFMQIAAILTINDMADEAGEEQQPAAGNDAPSLLDLVRETLSDVAQLGDLKALQGLVLNALYSQLSGRVLSLLTLNGIMVRLAQSLGLHRHDRRFKFKEGQVELRRRIWWWIYSFDKFGLTITHCPWAAE